MNKKKSAPTFEHLKIERRPSFIASVSVAKNFFEPLWPIYDEIRADTKNAFSPEYFPRLMFFATNGLFACETYLKSFYLLRNNQHNTSHDLWSLYRGLPIYEQGLIKENFDRESLHFGSQPPFRIVPVRKDIDPENTKRQLDQVKNQLDQYAQGTANGTPLKKFLKETKDSYTWWRYAHQGIRSENNPKTITLHYVQVMVFCVTMEKVSNSLIEKYSK